MSIVPDRLYHYGGVPVDVLVDVREHGAIGDGSVDDTDAIQDAIDALSAGQWLLIPSGTHKVTNVIFNPPDGCGLLAHGTLESSASGVAFTVGDSSGTTPARKYHINNLKVTSSSLDHTSGRIGILFRNIYEAYIDIREVYGFETGIKLLGSGAGCAYNEIHLGSIKDNKYSVYLNADSSGWTNENAFYGGRFTWSSGQDTSSFRHIWIDYYSTNKLNNNRFYNPSLEGAASTGADTACGIYNEGLFSFFYTPRFELDSANTKAEFTSNSTDSTLFFGYGLLSISNVTDAGTRTKIFARSDMSFTGGAVSSDSGVVQLRNLSTEGTAPILSFHGTDNASNARIYGSGSAEFGGEVTVSGSLVRKHVVTVTDANADRGHSIVKMLGGLIRRGTGDELTADRTDTTETAVNIVAGISNCIVGSGFEFLIANEDSTHTITLDGGVGVTMIPNDPSTAIPANSTGRFLVVVTNIGSGTEAVDVHALGYSTH